MDPNADDIVEVEMPRKDISKVFSMFHVEGIICSSIGEILMIHWVHRCLYIMMLDKDPKGFVNITIRIGCFLVFLSSSIITWFILFLGDHWQSSA